MNNKLFVGAMALVVGAAIGFALVLGGNRPEPTVHTNSKGEQHRLTTYKSPTCSCCGNWVNFMKGKGYKVEVKDVEDMDSIKEKYGIPEEMLSCHTTIVNDNEYFIEGHIPEESVLRLMEEEPNIQGIGMPGMPSGSPGMPGSKPAPFRIMQFDEQEKLELFEER